MCGQVKQESFLGLIIGDTGFALDYILDDVEQSNALGSSLGLLEWSIFRGINWI